MSADDNLVLAYRNLRRAHELVVFDTDADNLLRDRLLVATDALAGIDKPVEAPSVLDDLEVPADDPLRVLETDRFVSIPAAHLQDLRDIAAALETYQTDPLNVNHNAMAAKLREIAGES